VTVIRRARTVGMASGRDASENWRGDDGACPMRVTATVLGRKWHAIIVHRLLADGPSGFSELQRAIGTVSNKSLAGSLETLEREYGIVERRVISDQPFRVEYSLTDRGRSLAPVIEAMEAWGESYLGAPGSSDYSEPPRR
jgi:DNA-binding HxlR family transcriptional regulator